MKKIYLPCLLSLLFMINLEASAQKTYIVNNIPGAPADYRVLQQAIDSVPAGSIILLQPSGIAYDPVSIKKQLVIYGNGYFLGQNFAPATQVNMITSKIPYISFGAGSDGSIISGIDFSAPGNQDFHLNFDSTSNIIISRCYLQGVGPVAQGSRPRHANFHACSNISIQQCYIGMNGPFGDACSLVYFNNSATSSGLSFKNNLIIGSLAFSTFTDNYNNILLDHNTIVGTGSSFSFYGWIFTNNILLRLKTSPADTVIYPSNNQTMDPSSKNNICTYAALLPNPTINKILDNSVGSDSLFITSNNAQAITSTDGYYMLKTNSPAKSYSTDQTDCGAFGGSAPYVLSGLPAIPNIYFLQINQNATQGGGLKINIKAKANN